MVFELEIFLTGLFFIIFLVQVTILGFIFTYLIYKKFFSLPILELILLSMVIGFPLYIFYAYLVETFIVFNFFTINLPIMIFDSICLFYIYRKDPTFRTKLQFYYIKNYIKANKTNLIYYVIILSVIFIFQYIQQTSIMFLSDSLLAKDPYYWCEMQMYLIDYGHLNYERIQAYSAGMLFINGGSLLYYPQFRFIHSFYKFIPLFHLGLFIFIIFVFSKRFFKNKAVIFFCCIGFLLLRNFILRFLRPTPSVLSTIFAFLILLFFIEPKIPKKLIGFILAGTILFHPLYGFFLTIIYFIYFLYQLILILIKDNEKQETLKSFLRTHIMLFFIFSLLLIPFILNLTLKFKIDWVLNYFHYIFPKEMSFKTIANVNLFSVNNLNLFNNNLILLSLSPFNIWGIISDFGYATFSNDYIFYLILLFFIIVPSNNEKSTFVFLKIWFIFSFLFLLSFDFLAAIFPDECDTQLFVFFKVFRLRIFEFSAGAFLLIIGFLLEQFLISIKKLTKWLIQKYYRYKKLVFGSVLEIKKIIINIKTSKIRKIFRFETFFTIIILIFSIIQYFNTPVDYKYFQDDTMVDVILELSERTTPCSNETIIVPDFINSIPISYILYRFNSIGVNFSNIYEEILKIYNSNNVTYLLLPLNEVSLYDITLFLENFEVVYYNEDFIVITKK